MAILHALDHSIKSLEVLPYKVTNSAILRNCFICTVVSDIVSRGTTDRYVVYEGDCGVGDFGLKDICDIVMEVKSHDLLSNARSSYPTYRSRIPPQVRPAKCSASWSVYGGTPECWIVTAFSSSRLWTMRSLPPFFRTVN
jgi:hypothetical protein